MHAKEIARALGSQAMREGNRALTIGAQRPPARASETDLVGIRPELRGWTTPDPNCRGTRANAVGRIVSMRWA